MEGLILCWFVNFILLLHAFSLCILKLFLLSFMIKLTPKYFIWHTIFIPHIFLASDLQLNLRILHMFTSTSVKRVDFCSPWRWHMLNWIEFLFSDFSSYCRFIWSGFLVTSTSLIFKALHWHWYTSTVQLFRKWLIDHIF